MRSLRGDFVLGIAHAARLGARDGDAEVKRVLARQSMPFAIRVDLREICKRGVELHGDRLSSAHVDPLETVELLQRHSVGACARWVEKSQYHFVTVDGACVGDVDLVGD